MKEENTAAILEFEKVLKSIESIQDREIVYNGYLALKTKEGHISKILVIFSLDQR